jgi:hypothetical protein
MSNSQEQFDHASEQWLLKHRYTSDSQTLTRIANRVRENLEKFGGYISTAHFERAYLELVNEKSIKPFRGSVTEHAAAESPAIPADIVAFIESSTVSAFAQRRRYSQDPVFKKYYDQYATQQLKAQVAAEHSEETLTVEQYNSMRAIDVAKKYRSSAAFKRGVDKLVADGKI